MALPAAVPLNRSGYRESIGQSAGIASSIVRLFSFFGREQIGSQGISEASEIVKLRKPFVGIVTLFLAILAMDILWLRLDDRPPIWDVAVHLSTALDFSESFKHFTLTWKWFESLVLLGKFYPTLFHALMGVFFWLIHPSPHVGAATNAIPLGILLWATYRIGQKLFSDQAGRLAAFLVSTYPVMAWLAREALLDFALAAAVAAAAWIYLRTDNFSRTGPSVLFGAVGALGFLTKHGFIFYAFALALLAFYEMATRDEAPLRARTVRFRNFCLAHLIGVAGAALWYLPHWTDTREYFFLNRQLHYVLRQPEFMTAPSLLYLLDALTRVHMLLFPTLFLLVGIFFSVRRPSRGSLILYFCGFGSLIIMTFATIHREVRMSVASLPFFALLTAGGLYEIPSRRLRRILIGTLVVCALLEFELITFGIRGWPDSLTLFKARALEVNLYAQSYAQLVGPPRREDWKIGSILKTIQQDAIGQNRLHPRLGVVPDLPRFNHFDFILYSRLEATPMQIERTTEVLPGETFGDLDYVLIKSGDQGEPGTTRSNEEVNQFIQMHPQRFPFIAVFELPDRSQAMLFRRQ